MCVCACVRACVRPSVHFVCLTFYFSFVLPSSLPLIGSATLCQKYYLLCYSLMLLKFTHYAFEITHYSNIMHLKNVFKNENVSCSFCCIVQLNHAVLWAWVKGQCSVNISQTSALCTAWVYYTHNYSYA